MLIGEIIDELAALGAQVKMRNRVHLFDLNTVAEEFFREFLNILLQASFRNLNADTPNAPAIDLVDDGKRLAVQVTSKADTAKINHTLQKLSESNEDAYSRVIVLGLNPRQKSYAVDESLAAKYRFKAAKDVWDLDTLAKKAMGLEFERLQALHRLVRMSAARLRVELEIPDEEGNYPTSGYDLWERRAEPKFGTGEAFIRYLEEQKIPPPKRAALEKAIRTLAGRLTRLPRISREFLAALFERREQGNSDRFSHPWCHLLLSKVEREFRGATLEGELQILTHAGFAEINGEPLDDGSGPEIGIKIHTACDELGYDFVSFVETRKLSFRKIIGSVDFSEF